MQCVHIVELGHRHLPLMGQEWDCVARLRSVPVSILPTDMHKSRPCWGMEPISSSACKGRWEVGGEAGEESLLCSCVAPQCCLVEGTLGRNRQYLEMIWGKFKKYPIPPSVSLNLFLSLRYCEIAGWL